MLSAKFDLDTAFGNDADQDDYAQRQLHPKNRNGPLAKFHEDDPRRVAGDLLEDIAPDEPGMQPDQLRLIIVTLARYSWRGWSQIAVLPFVAGLGFKEGVEFHDEVAPLRDTLKEADRLLGCGCGIKAVIFALICKPVWPGGRQSAASLKHAVLVIKTSAGCFFVDDNGDHEAACNYFPWDPRGTHGPVRRLGQLPSGPFKPGHSTSLDALMDPAGLATRRLCAKYVAKAVAMLVLMREDEVLGMIEGPKGDSAKFYNRVHEPIFEELWTNLWSTLRCLPCSLFRVPSPAISSSLFMCRLTSVQMEAVTLYPNNVVAVCKMWGSDGKMTIRWTAPGNVKHVPAAAAKGNPLQMRVKWQGLSGGKTQWQSETFAGGDKMGGVKILLATGTGEVTPSVARTRVGMRSSLH